MLCVRALLMMAMALQVCFGFQKSVVDLRKCGGQYLRMCRHGTSEAVQRVLRQGLQLTHHNLNLVCNNNHTVVRLVSKSDTTHNHFALL